MPDDLAFVTFFSPWIDPTWPIGLWRHHAHSYTMAQALKFSRETVHALAACKESAMANAPGGFDEALHCVAVERRWRYGIMNPGLVQHVGETSVVGNGPLTGDSSDEELRRTRLRRERPAPLPARVLLVSIGWPAQRPDVLRLPRRRMVRRAQSDVLVVLHRRR